MWVTYTNASAEEFEDQPFNAGAQGELYLSKDRKTVVKLYTGSLGVRRLEALRKIISDYNITLTTDDKGTKNVSIPDQAELFAWPDAMSQRPRPGIRMRNVNYQRVHRPLSWWLSARTLRRVPDDIRGNWLDRTIVAKQMARIAWKLHGSGLCHSDFSGDNFLANVARRQVVLIDLDNLVVPDVLPPEMLGTGDFMAPEIVIANDRRDQGGKPRPSIQTDLHSLAVLIYQLLLNRHPLRGPKTHDPDAQRDDVLALGERALYIEDPDDRSNRPQGPFTGAWALGDEVEALMRRAFTVGLRNPEQRPLAPQWIDALARMADQIIPCTNAACPGNAFILATDRPAVCPWCGTPLTFPQHVPVLRLYSTIGQKGHFQSERTRIVGWQMRTLHRWHVFANVPESSVFGADREALAEIIFTREDGWLLRNLGLPQLRVAGEGRIRRLNVGERMPIQHGQHWLLDRSETGRIAQVLMQPVQ